MAKGSSASGLVGVDLGGTKIEIVATDRQFRQLAQVRVATPPGGPDAIVDAVAGGVASVLEAAGLGACDRIGVGVPGPVNPETGIVERCANIAGWVQPFPFGDRLSAAVGVPVVVDNDVRVTALGEKRLGAGRPFDDLLVVCFGTGVGGALILHGEVRRGPAGAAGEIGHMVVKPKGRRCGCGRRGCLEAYAGRGSMERRVRKLAARGVATDLLAIMKRRNRDRMTSSVIAEALDQRDAVAEELIDRAIEAAGVALAGAVNLTDVQAVVIGGGIGTRLGASFADHIHQAMRPHLFRTGPGSVVVIPAELGDSGGALGAAITAAELALPLAAERRRAAAR